MRLSAGRCTACTGLQAGGTATESARYVKSQALIPTTVGSDLFGSSAKAFGMNAELQEVGSRLPEWAPVLDRKRMTYCG